MPKLHVMRSDFFRPLAAMVIAGAALLAHSSPAQAQIDEARKGAFEKARDLIPQIVDAANSGKRSDADRMLDDFISNMNTVVDKLGRTGDRLHDEDKRWLGSTALTRAMTRLSVVKNHAVRVKQALAKPDENPSSTLSDFKSAWGEFITPFDEVWKEYQARAKEIQDRYKRFQDDCRSCF